MTASLTVGITAKVLPQRRFINEVQTFGWRNWVYLQGGTTSSSRKKRSGWKAFCRAVSTSRPENRCVKKKAATGRVYQLCEGGVFLKSLSHSQFFKVPSFCHSLTVCSLAVLAVKYILFPVIPSSTEKTSRKNKHAIRLTTFNS